jgi:regulator of sigma E protease
MMITLFTLFFSLIGLGILIIIHELGHLIAAKLVGMKVEAFGIGFGKPIVTFKVKDVVVNISWIPFGGYVKIAGMDELKESKASESSDGFFAKSPLARMCVAFAGPLANLLFCLFAFSIVWMAGGRTKPFSFATDRAGLLDQSSALYQQQVRPGDRILAYGGQPLSSSQDHFRAAMTAIGPVIVETESLLTKQKQAVTCSAYPNPYFAKKEVKTFGVLSPAAFLVLMPGTSLIGQVKTPFKPFDRILWVNGEMIFSMQQLKNAINKDDVYLTVQRGDKVLHISCPRCHVSDLKLAQEVRGELTDWMFEGGLTNKKISTLTFIPYNLSQDCTVEGPLEFLNQEGFQKQDLLPGDTILALWGTSVSKTFEILHLLQRPSAAVIVERNFAHRKVASLNELDQLFTQPYRSPELPFLIQNVGMAMADTSSSSLKLLKQVPLMTQEELVQEKLMPQVKLGKDAVSSKELYLGLLGLQDVTTKYNPSPKEAIKALFEEISSTLSALFSGTLSPKLMSGPIGIVQVIQQQWAYGPFDVLFWLGAISFNLGLINLLPLPVLDGGYIFMSLIEIITFRKVSSRISGKIIAPFAFLLIGLLIYLTYHDILRLISHISG